VSQAIHRRPSTQAATAVVPEPQQKSATSIPGSVAARRMRSSNSSGFCVGYPVRSFASCVIQGIVQTSSR